ncbi:hypothetical protein A9Q84_20575 [Halobacteriovorax marinus]|uniref:Secreted protein n=1 Tax=Halobacteriovorax marinus TaxID=97084 RepID=A0A1Y5F1A0_9BACT|nr:hypothetical protein A9Q84_20575 [Halobacteriovorax marinus]
MRILLVLCVLFHTALSIAANPSIEGLFRNPNSKAINGDLIVIKALIQREETDLAKFEPRFFKFIFSLEYEARIQFLQIEYKNGAMTKNGVMSTLFLNDLVPKVVNDELLERNLFYSFLIMYGLNKSDGMAGLLKKYSTMYMSNKDSLNQEKIELYDRYKKYLVAINNDETIKDDLQSPMESEDEEEKKRIAELKSTNMYVSNEKLKLEKIGNNFFLNLNIDGINARFTNEEHQLVSLKVTKGTTDVETYFSDYILFNGTHELPKHIMLKDQEKNIYNIRFLGYKIYTNKGDSLTKRALSYKKIEEKNLEKKNKLEKNLATEIPLTVNRDEKTISTERPILVY